MIKLEGSSLRKRRLFNFFIELDCFMFHLSQSQKFSCSDYCFHPYDTTSKTTVFSPFPHETPKQQKS